MEPRRLAPVGIVLLLSTLLSGCAPIVRKLRGARTATTASRTIVVLDPGHGGQDSGATSHGVREDTLTYRTAAVLARQLRRKGVTVVCTVDSAALALPETDVVDEPPLLRPRDARLAIDRTPILLRHAASPVDLWKRAAVARDVWRARRPGDRVFFLSIHYDSRSDDRSIRGVRISYDQRIGPNPPALAVALTDRFRRTRPDCPTHLDRRRFGVLNPEYNPVPESVLVELATITSAQDRALARDARWRREQAAQIADTILGLAANVARR